MERKIERFFASVLLVLTVAFAWRDRKRILLGMQSDMYSQTMYKAGSLMPGLDPKKNLETIDRYVAQSLNFFNIGPLDDETLARQQIEMTLCDANIAHRYADIYKATHDEDFQPAELVAAAAFLFYNVCAFLNRHRYTTEQAFISSMYDMRKLTRQDILRKYPRLGPQLDLFLEYFRIKYMSPWDMRRRSDRCTRANFGTGVDYITTF